MKKALPPFLFCITVALMIFLLLHKSIPVQPTSPTLSKEQIRAFHDAQIRSNNDSINQLHAQLQIIDQKRAENEKNLAEMKKHIEEEPSRTFSKNSVKAAALDQQAHLDVITGNDLKAQTDALQGEIEAYKKYNDFLIQQQNEKKEGAKKVESYMPIAVTAFLAFVALGLLIWRHGDPHAEKWVYSTFGAILGYWLKGGA